MSRSGHLSVSTVSMTTNPRVQKHELSFGDVRVDLQDYVPSGQKFWRREQVDQIVKRLRNELVAKQIRHEVDLGSHPGYDVLIITPYSTDDDEFEDDVKLTVTTVIETL